MYLSRWSDFGRDFENTFAALDLMRRSMDEMLRPGQPQAWRAAPRELSWPPTNLYDTGSELILSAAVPGMSEKDIEITAAGDTIHLAGERKIEVPEGYSVHRQERGSVRFARSFNLPCKVEHGKITASVKDGILTVRLPKAAEAQPRQITVRASA